MTKVLYVEDNDDNVFMLKMRLELLGDFEVLTAEDGEKGCAMAISESPDIILMDLEMPNVDGWEATRRLKGNPHLACLEQRLYCASEFWPSVGQLRGAHGKHIHLCLAVGAKRENSCRPRSSNGAKLLPCSATKPGRHINSQCGSRAFSRSASARSRPCV